VIYLSDQSVLLNWTAFDATPWSYEVYINSTLVETGWWYGSTVSYNFTPTAVGFWNVTILFRDAFDNIAIDQIILEVRARPFPVALVISVVVIAGIGVIVVVLLYFKKFKRTS